MADGEDCIGKEFVDHCGNSVVDEKVEKAEEIYTGLELEVEKKKTELELLKFKFVALDVEKLAIEDEIWGLKGSSEELHKDEVRDADWGDEDRVLQLMVENKVLECEKQQAESKVDQLKGRCKELESMVIGLQQRGTNSLEFDDKDVKMETIGVSTVNNVEWICTDKGMYDEQTSGATPAINLLRHAGRFKRVSLDDTETECQKRVRKRLAFTEDRVSEKRMAPLTPAGAKSAPFSCSNISDSADEGDTNDSNSHIPCVETLEKFTSTGGCVPDAASRYSYLPSDNNLMNNDSYQSDDDGIGFRCRASVISTPKQRRVPNMITSDSENDSDDNVPLSVLLSEHRKEQKIDAYQSEDDGIGFRCRASVISTPKQRRAPNMIASDSENDSDDYVPVSVILSEHRKEPKIDAQLYLHLATTTTNTGDRDRETVRRRRIMTLRECEQKGCSGEKAPCISGSPEAEYDSAVPVNDEEAERDELESEGESLDGFIVSSSDASEDADISNGDSLSDDRYSSGESEDLSRSSFDFGEIISKIGRKRDYKYSWNSQSEMLADFGKDPELCMKALCALYRQQKFKEKSWDESVFCKGRGFNKYDAPRGNTLADFLTDGDPQNDLKKSVEELQEFDPMGLDACQKLAMRYSGQLFSIYKNEEDPFFLPSSTTQ